MANNSETILKGRYRLLAQQGSGGMAVIYKAQDLELSRIVAVKILRPSLTADPTFLTRFKNEARSVANLQHPNIVTIYDVGSDGPTQFIVMEFVDGTDLKKIIKTEGILTVDRALKMAIQICAGIGFAHRAGLVHADVKPQNILVTKNDVVKVTDFGIAQAFSDTQPPEKQQVVWGSPHYFAPEQAKGEKPTPASDVYSIGVVMFEMLTGRLPYVGGDQQQLALAHIRDRVPMVTEFNPSVPDALAQIVYKVMSKEPAMRYRTADQLGHVLESYRDRGREVTSPNAPAFQAPPPPPPQYSQPSAPQQYPQQPAPLPFTSGQAPNAMPLPFTQGQQPSNAQSPFQQPPPLPFTQGQPPTSDPTQRYSLAPDAPQSPSYNRPQQQSAPTYNQSGTPQYPQPTPPQWGQSGSNSQPLYNYDRENDVPQALDAVTIALAVLAFFAVLCLIPLWIQVYLARFAGS
ncbi:MAG: serine/threonine protein kinase [Anaerolineae bacterium]|nr:serine/threonine protein kinase [Anaerolineae bacterium]